MHKLPLFGAFHALAVDEAGFARGFLSALDVEHMMDAIQRVIPVPQAKVIMHGASGCQLLAGTGKGLKICGLISSLYDRHFEQLGEGSITTEAMSTVNNFLRRLERVWAHDLAYGPKSLTELAPPPALSVA